MLNVLNIGKVYCFHYKKWFKIEMCERDKLVWFLDLPPWIIYSTTVGSVAKAMLVVTFPFIGMRKCICDTGYNTWNYLNTEYRNRTKVIPAVGTEDSLIQSDAARSHPTPHLDLYYLLLSRPRYHLKLSSKVSKKK